MATINYTGKNYDPIGRKGVIFEVSASGVENITIRATVPDNAAEGIRQVAAGTSRVNVADYATAVASSAPISEACNWADVGRVVNVSVGGTVTKLVNAEVNPIGEDPRLLSDLTERIISYGERDEVSVSIPAGESFELNDGTIVEGPACIALPVTGCGADFFEFVAGVPVRYRVIAKCGIRLCWVNRYGGIDYWTFEVEESEKLEVEKDKIYTDSGWKTIYAEEERTITVGSRSLSETTMHALSYILKSPKVWKVDGDGYTEMDVITTKTTISTVRNVCRLSIELRPVIK